MATTKIAVFGGGCFWCTEAVYQRIKGVRSVMPGYAGGTAADPTYEQVCAGGTGHAEVVRIEYDPAEVDYATLLDVFFAAHDPTTVDRQGNDVGPQYRSLILYTDEDQRIAAAAAIAALDKSGEAGGKVVTEVAPLTAFYPAEEHHRDYYLRNKDAPYCRVVIAPKLAKVERHLKKQ